MATLAELQDALKNADSAGDTNAATALANEIVRVRSLPQQSAAPQPTNDPGALQAALIGAGRMGMRVYRGLGQATLAADSLNPFLAPIAQRELSALKADEQDASQRYGQLQQQHPVATAVGEAAPLLPLPMGVSIRGAAAISALPGLVEYGSPTERLQQGALGALGGGIGSAVGKAVGAIASPAMEAASPEVSRLADVAAANKVPLDTAQLTGNPVLQNVKAALSRIPYTATGQQAADAAKQQAYNAALLSHVGSSGKAGTPDVMGDAYNAIVGKMNSAAASTALTVDDKAVDGLAKVESTYLRRLPTDQKPIIGSYLQDLTDLIGKEGGLPGDVYNSTRSELGRIAATTNNNTVRAGAKGLQKVLDDMFDRQAPADAVIAMKEARLQYSRYATLSDALKKGRNQDGNFSAKQVYAQAQQDIPGFERGAGGNFNDLVRAGRQFLPEPIPNSGTPERLLYQNLLTAGTMSGMGALGGALTGGDPISGAELGLLGFGLSRGAQKAINSPLLGRYLTSSALTPQQKLLVSRGGGLLGLAAVNGLSQ